MNMKKNAFLFLMLLLLGVTGICAQDLSQPSKKELYQRARDALKESLENGDMERSGQALDYLKENVKNGAPLNRFEEHLANMELQRFEEGILLYSDIRHIFLDPDYKTTDTRNSADDKLNQYLFRNLTPFTKQVADSLYARAEASDVKQEYKDLYKTLLYSELVIGFRTAYVGGMAFIYHVIADTTNAEDFLVSAKAFTEKYPLSEHSVYLKNKTIPFVQEFMDEQRLFRKDPIAKKYYTGGFDLYAGTWFGFVGGSINKIAEAESQTPIQLEAQIRYKRVSVGGFIDHAFAFKPKGYTESMKYYDTKSTAEMLGVTLGFTAFDSHYWRVEPFVGTGTSFIADGMLEYDITPLWVLGTNADFRFGWTKPSHPRGLSFAFMLRLKYKAMFGTAEPTVENGGHRDPSRGVAYHVFGLSLGVNIW